MFVFYVLNLYFSNIHQIEMLACVLALRRGEGWRNGQPLFYFVMWDHCWKQWCNWPCEVAIAMISITLIINNKNNYSNHNIRNNYNHHNDIHNDITIIMLMYVVYLNDTAIPYYYRCILIITIMFPQVYIKLACPAFAIFIFHILMENGY